MAQLIILVFYTILSTDQHAGLYSVKNTNFLVKKLGLCVTHSNLYIQAVFHNPTGQDCVACSKVTIMSIYMSIHF